jgi:hypothetical protein
MSPEVYREHTLEINAAVRVLLQNPASRRRYEVAAIYTAKGHEQLARILRTNFGIVAVLNFWNPKGAYESRMSTAADRTRGEYAKASLAMNFFRTHEHGLVIWPLTGKPDEDLMLTSRSRREPYVVIEEDILRRIERRPYEDGREFRHCDGLVFG